MAKQILGLVLSLSIIASPIIGAGADTWTAKGRLLKWSMQVPTGWIGGSADQIEQVRNIMENERVRQLLQQAWYSARQIDAYFLNMDVEGIKTRTPSSIAVNVSKRGFAPTMFTDEMYRALADIEEKRTGEPTQFIGSWRISVGGLLSFCASFKTTFRSGGSAYSEQCVVLLDAERMHTFKFQSDETKYPSHRRDFHAMLASLQYR